MGFFLTPWVTRLLFANAAMFLVTLTLGRIPQSLLLVPALILQRPWSLVTYMFLHAGLGHIFFNMLMLAIFGPRVEERLGATRFVRLYFASGFAAALLSILTPFAAILGASGAVFGVMYAFVRFWPRAQIWIWGVIPVEARVLFGISLVFAVLGIFGYGGQGVAHFAHLGGFLGGFVYLKWSEATSPAARFKAKAAAAAAPAVRPGGDHRDLDRWRRIPGDELHPLNREELNRILDKISATGVPSLSNAERAFLERFSATH
ncbi:MAG TPA: rhomboid family intramembrane serine protease [Gemmatimonadales bacterium]